MISFKKVYFARLIFFSLISLSSGFLVAAKAFAFELNDISVLLPLPKSIEDAALLSPQSVGAAGVLMPDFVKQALASEIAGVEQFRVVALRIDPCFPNLDFKHPENCRAQIRLVWQVLRFENHQVTSRDTAIHTFYEITQPELQQLLSEISQLKKNSSAVPAGQPLSVHPIISQQGLHGDYWQNLRALVLSLTGANRLSRFTLMVGANPFWTFQGFDVANNSARKISIPVLDKPIEVFSNFSRNSLNYLGGVGLNPQSPDAFNELVSNSQQFAHGQQTLKQKTVDAIFRVESPKFNNPETINCSSCHVAQGARSWFLRNSFEVDLENNPFRFQAGANSRPDNTYSTSTINLRNFGYFNKAPAISQRVVNETALIVKQLNSAAAK